jgi:Carboxypeptidase regulatory-like domain
MTAMLRRACAAIALSAVFMVVAPAANAATGSIAGTVTDAATAEPIEGVKACAESTDESSFACGLTETDGTYFIGGLEPGEYKVWFSSEGRHVFEYYDGAASWSDADPVAVLSGTKTVEIDADLQPTAAIEGTVLATADGLGVEEVEVCAYPLSAAEENFLECAETDSGGAYAINGLAPGSYRIEFWTGWTGRNLAYQFYDRRSRFAEADVVSLAEGERKSGVDADLAPGASISGNVSALATGLPLEEIRVCSIEAANGSLATCTWTNEQGNYTLRLLPGGSYKVVFSPELWEFFPGQAFPGEDDDGYPTQFWNNQPVLAAASVLSLGTGGGVGGISARLGAPAAAPPSVAPIVKPPARKRKKCRHGFKRKKVKGKVRCVRIHKRHRQRRHSGKKADAKRPMAVRFSRR